MKNAVRDAAEDTHGFLTNLRVGTKSRPTKQETYVTNLDFSNDIAFLENSKMACQSQLKTTSKRGNEVGLQINDKKTQNF